jgi:hypothetical protein
MMSTDFSSVSRQSRLANFQCRLAVTASGINDDDKLWEKCNQKRDIKVFTSIMDHHPDDRGVHGCFPILCSWRALPYNFERAVTFLYTYLMYSLLYIHHI